jgi:hypothetical protein
MENKFPLIFPPNKIVAKAIEIIYGPFSKGELSNFNAKSMA